MFWRKKPKIDKIETMKVSCEECTIGDVIGYIFSIHLERSFTENAKLALKPVIEDFLIAVNEKFCKGCYWLACAYDYKQYFSYEDSETSEISNYLMLNNPEFTYVKTEDVHIFLILNELNKGTFSVLKNAKLPNGDTLLLDTFDAIFMAFHTDDIDNLITLASKEDMLLDEAAKNFFDQDMEVYAWYFDSYGAKIHELAITCYASKKDTVKDCMVSIFFNHGIKLDFIDENII